MGRWQGALRLETRARGTEGAQDVWVREEEHCRKLVRESCCVNETLLVTFLIAMTKYLTWSVLRKESFSEITVEEEIYSPPW